MKAEILSWLYRRERARIIRQVFAKQDKEHRPRDFEEVFEVGDRKLRSLPRWAYTFPIPEGIGVELYDLHFPSPLTLAAFKTELDIIKIWSDFGLGGVCLKTAMKDDRDGNNRPRLQQVNSLSGLEGLLNAMGLPGPGVDKKIIEIDSSGILSSEKPTGFSIGGSSLEEYKYVFDRFNAYLSRKEGIQYYYEINISCPNTSEGQQMTKHPELLKELLTYMRQRTTAVIGVKMSPDTSDTELLRFADLLLTFERTFMNLGNTSYRKCVDVGLPEDAISTKGGGYSGPTLYRRTLEMTKVVAITCLPIIATGGIHTADQVRELRKHGASVVGVATSVGQDPYQIALMNYDLSEKAA